jgi:Holliday junction resolvase RusA-like endonuclease
MHQLSIVIPGCPIAKKRPRFFRRGGLVGTYNAQETEEGRAMQHLHRGLPEGWTPIDGAIRVWALFEMPIPKSASKKAKIGMQSNEIPHTKKPDLDNLVKFVKDCANGILWRDDSQVIRIEAAKRFSDNPRTQILIDWR